ncbi:MAG: tetratricopeptide repeat protein, partial [Aminivibrio sp.]
PLPPLEDKRKKAEALWNEAAALQQSFKYEDALELYKKGLEISPDDTVKAHAEKLEAFIPRAKARAEEIWNQAAGLQNTGKYEEALEKYREGLAVYHNQKVEDHVEKLEAFIARRKK